MSVQSSQTGGRHPSSSFRTVETLAPRLPSTFPVLSLHRDALFRTDPTEAVEGSVLVLGQMLSKRGSSGHVAVSKMVAIKTNSNFIVSMELYGVMSIQTQKKKAAKQPLVSSHARLKDGTIGSGTPGSVLVPDKSRKGVGANSRNAKCQPKKG